MPVEVNINNRQKKITILEQKGTFYKVLIGEREYELDVSKVEEGLYSILQEGKSINMEMMEGKSANKYIVNTRSQQYEVEILDAQIRYRKSSESELGISEHIIETPMPGKVVKILVEEGEKIETGQTLIVVSAMKMDSEYKSHTNGRIAHVLVKEGDTINGHQPLIEIEPEEIE